jgi:gluconate 2-dehydrogenase gamma chain
MMHRDSLPRRAFLIDAARAAAAGWLALELPFLVACARDDAKRDGALSHLTALEARALRSFAAQILPSDAKAPGAEEAGAVYFIDRALGMPFFAKHAPVVRAGLADLERRARAAGGKTFALLSSSEQISIMREIEHDDFFKTARTLVLIGVFADPSYGGNRHGAGSMIMAIDHRPSYTAPFGWYDAQTGSEQVRAAS